jgi:hypothetical protein
MTVVWCRTRWKQPSCSRRLADVGAADRRRRRDMLPSATEHNGQPCWDILMITAQACVSRSLAKGWSPRAPSGDPGRICGRRQGWLLHGGWCGSGDAMEMSEDEKSTLTDDAANAHIHGGPAGGKEGNARSLPR